MNEDRITRLARAICRAARLDPDRPLVAQVDVFCKADLRDPPQPAWMDYRAEAARLAKLDLASLDRS